MLTVHHLQVSQSERIVWLCEELAIPYTLRLHARDPIFSPQSIKDLHPLAAAPIIQDDGDGDDGDVLTLAESAACAEYIIHKHGGGRLALAPSHKRYADYLYWLHYANGTLQPAVGRCMTLKHAGVDEGNATNRRMLGRLDGYLGHMDERLGRTKAWLAGDDFTAADVMSVFTLTTMRTFYPLHLGKFANILSYLQRVGMREGYRRAHERGDPGMEYMLEGPPPKSFTSKI